MAKNHRLKLLVDQVSGQVIWLTYYYDSLPVPMFDQTLDMQRFRGDVDFDVWNSYLDFTLYCSGGVLYKKEINEEFKSRFEVTQLKRAKAIALDYINAGIDFQNEKSRVAYKGLHTIARSGHLFDEQWINYFQEEYGCSKESAIKLAEFKTQEVNDTEFFLESTRHTAYNQISKATTLEEVIDVYECTCTKLFYSMRPNLTNFSALKKPF